jgi:hypothetical protein
MTTICIQNCLAPQDSCTLYIPAERLNAIQPTIIHNLFFLLDNQSLDFFSVLEIFCCPRPRHPWGDRSPRPILLIQPPLHRVKPSVDQNSLSDHHRHWPPTQLHSHRHRCPRHHRIILGSLSHIGRPPLCQIHTATILIRLPPPDPAATRSTCRPIRPVPDPPAVQSSLYPIRLPPLSHRHRTDQAAAMPIHHRRSHSPLHQP